jgi:UrcA family protein
MNRISSRPIGKVILPGVAALVMAVSASALAASPQGATRISVDTHDIDLSSPTGIEKLHHRVNSAIRSACAPAEFGGAVDFGTHDASRAQWDCLSSAHAAAAPQVQKLIANGNPKVAAF